MFHFVFFHEYCFEFSKKYTLESANRSCEKFEKILHKCRWWEKKIIVGYNKGVMLKIYFDFLTQTLQMILFYISYRAFVKKMSQSHNSQVRHIFSCLENKIRGIHKLLWQKKGGARGDHEIPTIWCYINYFLLKTVNLWIWDTNLARSPDGLTSSMDAP